MIELKKIFENLGMNDQNCLYIIAENKWQEILPARQAVTECDFLSFRGNPRNLNLLGINELRFLTLVRNDALTYSVTACRIEWLIKEKLKPAAFFCIEKKPIVLFYDSPKDRETIFKAIWNFNESPIVIINEPNTVEIFNGLSYLKEGKILEKLGDGSNLGLFSYFELVTGKTWEEYRNKFEYQKRVDYKLLKNIQSAREVLIDKYKIDNFIANALIGKCIFVRYLIDRKVRINFDGNLREWTILNP
ncbi:hypothetical protein KKG56_03510 [bacterium]|nr:hypothetical protein [bacterium]